MSKIKQQYFDIALRVGGSHYPEVGGELLSRFADDLVSECVEVALSNGDLDTAQALQYKYGIKYDLSI